MKIIKSNYTLNNKQQKRLNDLKKMYKNKFNINKNNSTIINHALLELECMY